MIFRPAGLCIFSAVVLLAGCASSPRVSETAVSTTGPVSENRGTPDAVATPVTPRVEAPPEPVAHKKPSPAKPRPESAGAPALKEGEHALTVESEPSGATVVVNGKPCGKTPCRVVVRANGRGFLREQVSIKVRFIAATAAQSSQTVEEVLTTLDKVPAAIRFTVAGAARVVK